MDTLKTSKQAVLQAAKSMGLFQAVANSKFWRGQRLLIIGFHGVSLADEHEWNPGLYIESHVFRQRLEALRDGGYNVLPLEEALRMLYAGKLPPKSVVLTFDDGAHDFYTLAYPLLREFGFPSTLYLTTFYCRYQAPVFDTVCSYLLWKGRGRMLDGAGLVEGGGELGIRTKREWQETARRIYNYVRAEHIPAERKKDLAEELARRLEIDYEPIRAKRMLYIMTPEEVAEVSANGVSIQLHTHRHRTPLDRELFQREIRDNAREIQDITGTRPVHFCYPLGAYDPRFGPWLQEMNVISAAGCEAALASSASDPLCLPRMLDQQICTPIEFEAWLTGASAWIPHRKGSSVVGA